MSGDGADARISQAVTLHDLQTEVAKLQKKKAIMQAQRHQMTLSQRFAERSGKRTASTLVLSDTDVEELATKRSMAHQAGETIRAHRLCGCSCFEYNAKNTSNVDTHSTDETERQPTDTNRSTHTAIRFETCYNGQFYEQYYAVVSNTTHEITAHTLPSFVDINKFKLEFTQSRQQAISSLLLTLNAFVARREQLEVARGILKDMLVSDVVNATCDLVEWEIASPTGVAVCLALTTTQPGSFDLDSIRIRRKGTVTPDRPLQQKLASAKTLPTQMSILTHLITAES
jgi:hypothetical protein